MTHAATAAPVHVEPFRVRFDECTPDSVLRTSVYVRYLQETAGLHSASAGYTREWYWQAGLFWLVRTVDLLILHPARLGETVRVSTEVTGFRRIWARRRSEVRDADGTLLAEAAIDWVLTSGETGRPTRIPAELHERFPTRPADFDPGRVELGDPPADVGGLAVDRRRVEAHELDPMGHLNNASYLDTSRRRSRGRRQGAPAGVAPLPDRIPRPRRAGDAARRARLACRRRLGLAARRGRSRGGRSRPRDGGSG